MKKVKVLFTLFFAFLLTMATTFAVVNMEEASGIYVKAEEISEVQKDLNAINLPSTTIISFPVTWESVYGNTITWTVQEEQTVITYDSEAHWMVVDRSKVESGTATIKITVTVSDGVTSLSKEFDVNVPSGTTTTRTFTIKYDLGYDNQTLEDGSYTLGQATFALPSPTREGYIFEGWYDGEVRVEKILVGSMKNYELTARWTQDTLVGLEIETNPTKVTYNALEDFDPTGMKVNLVYLSGKKVQVSDYTVDKTTLHGDNTSVTVSHSGYSKDVAITVNKIDVDMSGVVFNNQTVKYNGLEQLIEATSLPEGVTVKGYTGGGTNVGTYTVTVEFELTAEAAKDYNTPESKTATLTIEKASLTATFKTPFEINYGAALPSITLDDLEFAGFVNNETVSVVSGTLVITYTTSEGVTVERPTEVGTYNVIASGLTADNYEIQYNVGTLTISASTLSIEAQTPLSVTYNGQNQTFTAKVFDGVAEVEDITLTYKIGEEVFSGATNVGTYQVTVSFSDETHGTKSKTFEFEITKKAATITAENKSSVYGETVKDLTATVDGTVDGESLVYTLTKAEGTNAGEYAITVNFDAENAVNKNYDIQVTNATYTITKKAATITAENKSSVYGETVENLTAIVAGTVNEESLVYTLTKAEGTNVGTYAITVSFDAENAVNKNYDIQVTNATYTITKKAATITAENKTSVYGETLKDLTATVDGTVNEESLVYTLTKAEGTNAGTYTITVNFDAENAVNKNYDIQVTNATYTITKKAATITAQDKTSVYGETLKDLTATVAGTVNEESLVYTLTKAEGNNVGTYVITVSFDAENAVNKNYDIQVTNATYIITVLDLSTLAQVTVQGSDFIHTGSELTPAVEVTYNKDVISAESYTLSYANNKELGTATITVTFKGNYTGSKEVTFVITQNGMAAEIGNALDTMYQSVLTGRKTSLDNLATALQGATITWISNNTAVAVASDGVVTITRPATVNAEVTLTATINYGTTSADTREYTFVVPALGKEQTTNDVTVSNTPQESTLEVSTVDAQEDLANYEVLVGDDHTVVVAYDIKLKNGEATMQPDGTVTVKLPIPEGYDGATLKVYYVNGSTATDMNATVEGNYLVFTTDHFSVYVIAGEAEQPAIVTETLVFSQITGIVNAQAFVGDYKGSALGISDLFNFNFDKNGGSNDIAYYTTGTALRVYAKGKITVNCSKVIESIIITYSGTSYSGGTVIVGGTSITSSTATSVKAVINNNSFEIQNKTSDQLRIKSIEITYENRELTDAEKVAYDKAALTLSETVVTADFTLPETGAKGSSIAWEVLSGTAIAVDGAAATVTRPTYNEGDATVTLKATITCGTSKDSKEFEVTVTASDPELTDAEKVAYDKASLTLPETVEADFELSQLGEKGSSITWEVLSGSAITVDGAAAKVTRPAASEADATVTLKATITCGESQDSKELTVTVKAEVAAQQANKVTDVNSLQAGDKIILVCETKNVVAGALSSSILARVDATITDGTISSIPESAIILTLGGETGSWTFANSEGKLLGATAVKKLAFGSGTTTWTISIDTSSGNATIDNTTASYGSLLYNASSPRFTTYASGQTAIQIYKLSDQ